MDVGIKSMLLLQESVLIKRSIGGLYGGFGVVLLVVVLTPSHLAMEYAAGGELFEQICDIGRFSKEKEAIIKVEPNLHIDSSKDLDI
ncbi:conserved hypothetical protein [Ricinus communis]|uniref:Uncharacterized protein n=1 Tax=Ricinus communis TaxID=3988 RepID=B9RVJ3_RICCO|nr:conserved hypothetical protein [Ricinus communis]